jgi:hypothetical protein
VCDSPELSAHYYTQGTKLEASSLTQQLDETEERSEISGSNGGEYEV